jgi:hypothetical protein
VNRRLYHPVAFHDLNVDLGRQRIEQAGPKDGPRRIPRVQAGAEVGDAVQTADIRLRLGIADRRKRKKRGVVAQVFDDTAGNRLGKARRSARRTGWDRRRTAGY